MNDIDPVFVAAIRERTEGDVHVEELLAGARRRGVRHVRTRRALITASAACAVLAVAGAAALIPWGSPATPPPPAATNTARPGPSATPSVTPSGLRRPAAISGMRTLAEGGTVGEGHQLHLDTTDPEARQIFWVSGDALESLYVNRGDEGSQVSYIAYTVQVSSSESGLNKLDADLAGVLTGTPQTEQLTVGGRPATLSYTDNWAKLRWRPRDNVWALAWLRFRDGPPAAGAARAATTEIAGQLRLDRVLRCAVTFRLTWAPAEARVVSCGAGSATDDEHVLPPDVGRHSAGVAVPGGGTFYVSVLPLGNDEVKPNTTYKGHPVEYGRDRSKIDIGDRTYTVEAGTSSLSRDDLLHVLVGIEPASPNTDPLAR